LNGSTVMLWMLFTPLFVSHVTPAIVAFKVSFHTKRFVSKRV
jgi:hypothetical protein